MYLLKKLSLFSIVKAFTILWLISLSACSWFQPRDPGEPVSLAEAQALLERALEAEERVFSLRGEVKAKVRGLGPAIPVRQTILTKEPASLRLVAFGPFGQLLFIVNLNEGEIQVVNMAENIIYYGDAEPENLCRIIPSNLEAAELIGVLLGRLPIIVDGDVVKARRYAGSGLVKIIMKNSTDKISQEIMIEEATGRLIGLQCSSPDNQDSYFIGLSAFTAIDGQEFPMERRLELNNGKKGLSLIFTSVKLNQEISDSFFQLKPPGGMNMIPLEKGLPSCH